MEGFRYIDLFCGIGGFHQAMESLGGTCVFASDIDPDCRKTYERNYGIEPAGDITRVSEDDIPDHDLLCGGFPCQAFSKAGKREGFNDRTKGTLFFEIMRIARAKRPRWMLLENVRNLASHDGGNTWKVICETIRDAGYDVTPQPVIFSPHWIGIPQHRERVFIMAVRKDIGRLPAFTFNEQMRTPCSVWDVLEKEVDGKYRISGELEEVINHWNKLVRHLSEVGRDVPTFPIWTDCFNENADREDRLASLPKWKSVITKKNAEFYRQNRKFIDGWMKDGESISAFYGAKAKFEWQAGKYGKPDIWDNIIQLRPSGIRVKPGTYFPALVAIVQIPIIGPLKRTLTPRECARLQSFPDTFSFDEKEQQAYKQFGNSVNVEVVKLFAEFLMDFNGTRQKYSKNENRLF